MNVGETSGHQPIASLGVLSAAAYAFRRQVVRSTWMRYSEVRCGSLITRFVVATPWVAPGAKNNEVDVARKLQFSVRREATLHGDMIELTTNATGRMVGPLIAMYHWFTFAVSNEPYRRARYIAKMDDDVFLVPPLLTAHLSAIDRSRLVYYGRFYFTNWFNHSFEHFGSSYTASGARYAGRSCHHVAQPCRGPFPYTTGSCVMLSHNLADIFVSDPLVRADVERSRALLHHSGAATKRGPAYEDAWMGYALSFLLPKGLRILHAHLDAIFYSDRPENMKHFELTNVTMIIHPSKQTDNRGKVPSYSWEGRMRAAHEHALLPRCNVGRLWCKPERPQMRDGSEECSMAIPPTAECLQALESGNQSRFPLWDLRWQVKRETERHHAGAAFADPSPGTLRWPNGAPCRELRTVL